MELDLHFMIIYLYIRFESNIQTFSKDIEWKPFLLRTDGTDRSKGMDVRTDSADTIHTPPPPPPPTSSLKKKWRGHKHV